MKILIITDIFFIKGNGVCILENRKFYNIPESWAKLFLQERVGAEYIKVEALKNE